MQLSRNQFAWFLPFSVALWSSWLVQAQSPTEPSNLTPLSSSEAADFADETLLSPVRTLAGLPGDLYRNAVNNLLLPPQQRFGNPWAAQMSPIDNTPFPTSFDDATSVLPSPNAAMQTRQVQPNLYYRPLPSLWRLLRPGPNSQVCPLCLSPVKSIYPYTLGGNPYSTMRFSNGQPLYNMQRAAQAQPMLAAEPQGGQAQPMLAAEPRAAQAQSIFGTVPRAAQAQPMFATVPQAAQAQPMLATEPRAAQVQPIFGTVPRAAQAQPMFSTVPQAAQAQPMLADEPRAAQAQPKLAGEPGAAQKTELPSTINDTVQPLGPVEARNSPPEPPSAEDESYNQGDWFKNKKYNNKKYENENPEEQRVTTKRPSYALHLSPILFINIGEETSDPHQAILVTPNIEGMLTSTATSQNVNSKLLHKMSPRRLEQVSKNNPLSIDGRSNPERSL